MRNYRLLVVASMALFFLTTSCGKEGDGPTTSPIVGVWSFNKFEVTELTFNGQDFTTYLQSQGLTQDDIDSYINTIETSAENELDMSDVKVEFKADNSYTSSQPNQTDQTGSWTLSDDKKTLTVDDMDYTVKTLTSSQLILEVSQEETSSEGTIKIAIQLTFVK